MPPVNLKYLHKQEFAMLFSRTHSWKIIGNTESRKHS